MPKYIVSTMIQSANIDNNKPVDVNWYRGDSLAQAIAAMTSAAAHHEEVRQNASIPAGARYNTLGVTLSIEQEVAPLVPRIDSRAETRANTVGDPDRGATPSTVTFDTETESFALSDCIYYDTPKRDLPKWAYGDCAGPRTGVVNGGDHDDKVMCEKHFNAMPRN